MTCLGEKSTDFAAEIVLELLEQLTVANEARVSALQLGTIESTFTPIVFEQFLKMVFGRQYLRPGHRERLSTVYRVVKVRASREKDE